jgi:prolyl-tRNA synthetase
MAGAYSYLPLGLLVLRKIADIVRNRLNQLPHTSEIQMTVLQARELWQQTERWDDPGMREVMYRVGDDDSVGIGPTHEEQVTSIFASLFSSYKQVPVAAYQIQTKFRKEARAKSGLLRGREFLMKDLYSFHDTEASLDDYYEQAAAAYLDIFSALGLTAIRTQASGGVFSKQHSDEFQVICEVGEDTIYLSADGTTAWNDEVVTDPTSADLLEFSGGVVRTAKAVEVGNIFRLGTKFSAPLGAEITNESGNRSAVYMGCYGIGVSRLVGVLVELFGTLGDAQGKGARIVWPKSVAPVQVHLLDLLGNGAGETLYKQLLAAGVEVLWDDRDGRSAGEAFADADLIGAPVRVVLSKRSQEAGGVEITAWPNSESSIAGESEAVAAITALVRGE